jgi:hypothetical protein
MQEGFLTVPQILLDDILYEQIHSYLVTALRLVDCGAKPPSGPCSATQQLLVASLPAEAPLEHNFRYPRIRELTLDNDGIALGGCSRTF